MLLTVAIDYTFPPAQLPGCAEAHLELGAGSSPRCVHAAQYGQSRAHSASHSYTYVSVHQYYLSSCVVLMTAFHNTGLETGSGLILVNPKQGDPVSTCTDCISTALGACICVRLGFNQLGSVGSSQLAGAWMNCQHLLACSLACAQPPGLRP